MRGLLCAAACLPAGFGIAAATGIRPLGGLVLVASALLAGRWSSAGAGRQAGWYAVVAACFVLSHFLARATGGWVAVAIVALVATAGYVVLLRPAAPALGG